MCSKRGDNLELKDLLRLNNDLELFFIARNVVTITTDTLLVMLFPKKDLSGTKTANQTERPSADSLDKRPPITER